MNVCHADCNLTPANAITLRFFQRAEYGTCGRHVPLDNCEPSSLLFLFLLCFQTFSLHADRVFVLFQVSYAPSCVLRHEAQSTAGAATACEILLCFHVLHARIVGFMFWLAFRPQLCLFVWCVHICTQCA